MEEIKSEENNLPSHTNNQGGAKNDSLPLPQSKSPRSQSHNSPNSQQLQAIENMLIDQKFLDEHDREELAGSIAYDDRGAGEDDPDKPKKNKGKISGIVSSLRNSISKKQGAHEKKNRAISGITYENSIGSPSAPNGVNAEDQRSKQPQSIADVSAIY